MNNFYLSVIKRFARVFIAGAVAQVALTIQTTDYTDLSAWSRVIILSAITGGLTALDKALRFE